MITLIASARSEKVVKYLDEGDLWGHLHLIDPKFEDMDRDDAIKYIEKQGYHQEDVDEAFRQSGLVR